MIIELAGIPGCGKTTYAKQILHTHQDCIVVDNTCLENCKSIVPLLRHFGSLYFRLAIKLLMCCGFSQQTLFQIKCLGRNMQKYVYALGLGAERKKIVLIDEGFAAPIISIVNQAHIPEIWRIVEKNKQFSRKCPQVRFGILAADPDTCADRILSRSQSLPYTLRNLSYEEMKAALQTMESRLNCLRSCLSDRFPVHDISF